MDWLIGAVVISAAVAFGYRSHQEKRRQIRTLMEKLARRRGGRVLPGSWLVNPKLLLDHGDAEIMVSAMPGGNTSGRNRPPSTFAHYYPRTPPDFRLHIQGPSLATKMAGLTRFRTFETGNPDFDRRFVVESTDPRILWDLLDERLIHKLLEFGKQDGLEVRLQPAKPFENGRLVPGEPLPRLSVDISKVSTDPADYERLITTVVLFAERLAKATARSREARRHPLGTPDRRR